MFPLLQRFATERGLKVAIHAPPQVGKSVWVSQRLPAYLMGLDPEHRVYIASQSMTHSTRFGRVVHGLMQQPSFTRWAHSQALVRRDASGEEFFTLGRQLLNDAQPSYKALGISRGLVGTGPDTLIIDDPYGSAKEARSKAINDGIWNDFHKGTVEPRLMEGANLLVMFHRYDPMDYAGRLIATGDFLHVRFPGLADDNDDGSDPTGRAPGEPLSPRTGTARLLKLRDEDPLTFAGQYQGRPVPVGGTLIRREWLREIPLSHVPKIDLWIRFWDLATKKEQTGDFTAGALVGIGPSQEIYLMDMAHFREEWPSARETIKAVTVRDSLWVQRMNAANPGLNARYQVGFEEVFWQMPMVQDLLTNGTFQRIPSQPVKPVGDKKARASGWIARAKYGQFFMVQGPWDANGFVDEAIIFNGLGLTHDDQIDAVSGAYELTWTLRGGAQEEELPPAPGTDEYYEQLYRDAAAARDGTDDNSY